MTDKKIEGLKAEVFKALQCLHLEVSPDGGIVEDIMGKVHALVTALETRLEVAEAVDKKMDIILKALKK